MSNKAQLLRSTYLNLFLQVVFLLLVVSCHAASTQPAFPKHFDRNTVSTLIDKIEEKNNFAILKAGYFLSHSHPDFPVKSGLALVNTRIRGEKLNSKRWFLLKWLFAFGSLRQGEESRKSALQSYSDIFDSGLKAPRNPALDAVLNRVIRDYVATLPGGYVTGEGQDIGSSEQTLTKALKLHFRLGSVSVSNDINSRRPDWLDVVWRVSSNDSVWVNIVEEAVKDKKVPKNYSFYRCASDVVRSANTSRNPVLTKKALSLLNEAIKISSSDAQKEEARTEYLMIEKQLEAAK